MSWITSHAAAWQREYAQGRYRGDPPDPFTDDVLRLARGAGVADGLDVGCGNGRNLVPLLDAGLPLTGIDVSPTAIDQFRAARPEYADRVRVAHLGQLSRGVRFDLVVGIQVFMFGDRAQAHEHLLSAQDRVRPGGLLALRANAVGTDVWPRHEVVETDDDGSFSVMYRAGAKDGLRVHFFCETELAELFDGWEPLLRLRRDSRRRQNGQGQWTQFEAIWRRPAQHAAGGLLPLASASG